jgi:hypothetical protein
VSDILPLSRILSVHAIESPLKGTFDSCLKIVHGQKAWILSGDAQDVETWKEKLHF